MGNPTISMAIFNSKLLVYQGVKYCHPDGNQQNHGITPYVYDVYLYLYFGEP